MHDNSALFNALYSLFCRVGRNRHSVLYVAELFL